MINIVIYVVTILIGWGFMYIGNNEDTGNNEGIDNSESEVRSNLAIVFFVSGLIMLGWAAVNLANVLVK